MENLKDNKHILYSNFFKKDDLKKNININILEKSINEQRRACFSNGSLCESDVEKLTDEQVRKYLEFYDLDNKDLSPAFELGGIANYFVEKIKNIKDFNLFLDKRLILQNKILSDFPLLNSVIKHKQNHLEEELITDEIKMLSKDLEIFENETGMILLKSNSVFLQIEIAKIHEKLKGIENRIDSEMNQTVVELAAIFEGLGKDLIEFEMKHFRTIAEIAKEKDIDFDFSLLDNTKTIEEIKQNLLEEATTNATMGDLETWLKRTLKSLLKGSSVQEFFSDKRFQELNELFYRRNLIAHNNSEVNSLYISKNPETTFSKKSEIVSDVDYLNSKVDLVLESGLLMIMKFFSSKDELKGMFSNYILEHLGLPLLSDGYYEAASIVFKKQYELLRDTVGLNTPSCFIAFFNYCLASLIDTGELPKNQIGKIDTIISRLERNSEWFRIDPQLNLIAKSVLLKKSNQELLESVKTFFDLNDSKSMRNEEESKQYKINFLGLPVFKLLENDPQFIDYKYSLSYT